MRDELAGRDAALADVLEQARPLAGDGRLVRVECVELAIVPLIVALRRRRGILVLLALAATGFAEWGRRRDGGRHVFAPSAAWWASAWVRERGATSWIALALRGSGGVRYAGARVTLAATPMRVLRRRAADGG